VLLQHVLLLLPLLPPAALLLLLWQFLQLRPLAAAC
jgi:hypothetical protein